MGRGDRIRHKMALKEQKVGKVEGGKGKGDKKVQKKLFSTRKNEVGGIKRLEEGTGAVREEAEVGEVFVRDREGTKYYVRDGNLVKEGEEGGERRTQDDDENVRYDD